MLKVIDIIVISVGSIAVVLYATLKIMQLLKYKKLVKQFITEGLSETDARIKANAVLNKKQTKQQEDNDDIYDF